MDEQTKIELARYRAKHLSEGLTVEECREVLRIMREGRMNASAQPVKSRKRALSTEEGDALLNDLLA